MDLKPHGEPHCEAQQPQAAREPSHVRDKAVKAAETVGTLVVQRKPVYPAGCMGGRWGGLSTAPPALLEASVPTRPSGPPILYALPPSLPPRAFPQDEALPPQTQASPERSKCSMNHRRMNERTHQAALG